MTQHYAHLPQMNMPFAGAKLAILLTGRVLVIQRDARDDIPYPGFWDLPGGGREGDETPLACALRETREELGLQIAPERLAWGRCYCEGGARTWFFVTRTADSVVRHLQFGDEGQRWSAMPVSAFLKHPKAVPHFRSRLAEYLARASDKEKPPASSSGGR